MNDMNNATNIDIFECSDAHDNTTDVTVNSSQELAWTMQVLVAVPCRTPECTHVLLYPLDEEYTQRVVVCPVCRQRYVLVIGELLAEVKIYPEIGGNLA
ncbi:hypothetical protein [Dictyobacter formicarum]|uniref:Uncharacterized protein n=1 Tax=Dictyobacter formicarum TaxID=2778368 RepID=A0ABQ3VQX2_9CHLR|nr:hypothetical protein [Dictyobacter formicarum]GHO88215.1 hypothetical protein KSZ_62210 [Dictyobacter formicarum]